MFHTYIKVPLFIMILMTTLVVYKRNKYQTPLGFVAVAWGRL